MNIYILGPVGSGKSTISSLLAGRLGREYVPEFEDNDLTFHRLLNVRNTLNTRASKNNFQYYTFEQAYRRQVNKDNVVIDTPILQHKMMAKMSLTEEDYDDYIRYFNKYIDKVLPTKNDLVFVLKLDFSKCVERIKLRGRIEEKLSSEELTFYKDFYNTLYSEMKGKAIFIDANGNPETIINSIISEVHKYY